MIQGEDFADELAIATGLTFQDALAVMRHCTYQEITFMVQQLELLRSPDFITSTRAGGLLQVLVNRALFVADALGRDRPQVCRFETVRPNPAFL